MNSFLCRDAACVTCVFLFGLFMPANSQRIDNTGADEQQFTAMFYNTENLFDTWNDSLTGDDDFTPAGAMHWTYKRYVTKLDNLYKTIVAVGGWTPPDVIGLCEVENKVVLLDLVNKTPLSKYPYRIVHADSPDKRGIDVALLYNSATVQMIGHHYARIEKPGLFTRDILCCKILLGGKTCHFFINHWPSRSTGQLETEPNRIAAAKCLRVLADSLFSAEPDARIIILGDLNDEPEDKSLVEHLEASVQLSDPSPASLYNLTHAPGKGNYKGSLKYQGAWNIFDQVIVSGNLLMNNGDLQVTPEGYRIFGESFLLEPDERFAGYKPFRTYSGYRYLGGFSDHLPVFVRLFIPCHSER